ncbi:MAG: tRNA 2-thiouridine(34) synthase MnmA [Eubacterium sp.]
MKNKKNVVIGISGGIDSTAAALLLKNEGYTVFGVTFNFFGDQALLKSAKKAAEYLGIQHEILDCRKDFKKTVIEPFIDGYLKGYTPNPCVLCDKEMKFKNLIDYADSHDAFYIATGHYLQLKEENGEIQLLKSLNLNKDQSYYLYTLDQNTLRRLIFPLERYESKDHVRQLLTNAHIEISFNKESQGICFIPDGNYGRFIRKELPLSLLPSGRFKESKSGKILGSHPGFYYFTVGQRKKLGTAFQKKYCVVEIRPETNEVVLGNESELLTNYIYFKESHFILNLKIEKDKLITFKICRWGYELEGFLNINDNGCGFIKSKIHVRAPMPGQSIVFYNENVLIGGGTIEYNVKINKK